MWTAAIKSRESHGDRKRRLKIFTRTSGRIIARKDRPFPSIWDRYIRCESLLRLTGFDWSFYLQVAGILDTMRFDFNISLILPARGNEQRKGATWNEGEKKKKEKKIENNERRRTSVSGSLHRFRKNLKNQRINRNIDERPPLFFFFLQLQLR